MDDMLESEILYEAITAHFKIFGKFFSRVLPSAKTFRTYSKYTNLFPVEIFLILLAVLLLVVYRKQAEVLRKAFIVYIRQASPVSRIPLAASTFSTTTSASPTVTSDSDKWEARGTRSACFAVQGRRPRMEDRFTLIESIGNTDIGIYAVYDGHGGEFAAEFIQKRMVERIQKKLEDVQKFIASGDANKPDPHPAVSRKPSAGKEKKVVTEDKSNSEEEKENSTKDENRNVTKPEKNNNETDKEKTNGNFGKPPLSPTVKKTSAVTRVRRLSGGKEMKEDLLQTNRRNSLQALSNSVANSNTCPKTEEKPNDLKKYIDGKQISLARILKDEIMALDLALIEAAKKTSNIAGTTLLIALLDRRQKKLLVANVGDSRGIMCDSKGKVIPLSFDHKPQQLKEHRRIKEAGGFISFNGVWRVAGILATSRALGDYPLKDRKLVIADPDILTFDLADHQPKFLLLASDGLWDAFSNDEAAAYINSRLNEPHLGAKSIAYQSVSRGSLDNVTALVVDLRNEDFSKVPRK